MMKEDNRSMVEARNIELERMKQSLELQLTQMANKIKEANQDPLTGLRNRAGIKEDINEHLLKNNAGTFIIMDLDNFKSVNDTYGHLEGDQMLVKVANSLNNYLLEGEILSRIGGDEFIIYIPYTNDRIEISKRAAKLTKKIEKDLINPGRLAKVTTSVGIALAPADGEDFETLYSHADIALYESKHKGKNRFSFYDEIEIIASVYADNKRALLGDILRNIREKEMEGSFLVEYDNFEKIYRYIERNISRDNREVHCVLLSIEEIEDEKMQRIHMQHLLDSVVSLLRKGDVVTKYSDTQVLMLLSDINSENTNKVVDRILEKYRFEERGQALEVTFEVSKLQEEKSVC